MVLKEGKEGIEAKGMISLELTIGSKTLATAFFVADVQGNYNVLLGRDWIHANQCVPSTMHQQRSSNGLTMKWIFSALVIWLSLP